MSSANEKLFAALFRRKVGIYDDECQIWRVTPSTDYSKAALYVVRNGLTERDPEWYAVLGRNGEPVDLNEDELKLIQAEEARVKSIEEDV